MTVTTSFGASLLGILLEATAITNVADNAASSPLTNLYIALHTASPGIAGDQTTSEATYGGYARIAVARSGSGWTTTGLTATNDGAITFATATSGSETIRSASIGSLVSGAGVLYIFGGLTTPLVITAGVAPVIAAGDLDLLIA